tara:strand:+ start:5191 stop:5670 length:480 start_codon:yes stop_codon:yes gene_type:complete
MNLDKLLIDILKKNSESLLDKDKIAMDDEVLIKKVAFDFYKVDNDPYNGLWKSEESDDGKTYLVRASDPRFDHKQSGDWSAISDYDSTNVTLSYKAIPIVRLSGEEYGFSKDNIFEFKDAVLDKVSSDSRFLNEIISGQPDSKLSAIYQSFPELNNDRG